MKKPKYVTEISRLMRTIKGPSGQCPRCLSLRSVGGWRLKGRRLVPFVELKHGFFTVCKQINMPRFLGWTVVGGWYFGFVVSMQDMEITATYVEYLKLI